MMEIKIKNIRNKILNFLILSLFFVLPFERIPTLEISGFTVKSSYLVALILIFFVLFSGWTKQITRQKLSKSDLLLIVFWIIGAVALSKTADLKRSFIIIMLWAFVFILYLFLSRYLKDEKLRRKTEDYLLAITFFVCIFGIYQFIGNSLGLSAALTGIRASYSKEILGFPRIQSVALEPLYFANFLMVPFFISLYRFIQRGKVFQRYFWLSSLILTNIILAVSRGAYIAIGISLLGLILFLIFKSYKRYRSKLLDIFYIIVISIALSSALIYKLNGLKEFENFISHSTVENAQVSSDGSALVRIDTYKIALGLFKKSPIIGQGVGNFGILTTPKNDIAKAGFGTVNNEYLEILTETGILGALAFLAFMIFYLKELVIGLKKSVPEKQLAIIVLFLGMLAIFIQYNFFSTLYIIYIWVFLALLRAEASDNKIN